MSPGDLDEVYSEPPSAERKAPGAYFVNGNLFFRLLDGQTINCQCIKEPWASKIVDLFNKRAS